MYKLIVLIIENTYKIFSKLNKCINTQNLKLRLLEQKIYIGKSLGMCGKSYIITLVCVSYNH